MSERVDTREAIDADGHILEPPDLWESYLEKKYRDRALRIRQNPEGLEYLEIDGKPSKLTSPGFPWALGAMGKSDIEPRPDRTYLSGAPPGASNPRERVARLDEEGLAKAVLYPSLGLLWEAELDDPELSAAYCRAYNRWIVDFCKDSSGRLFPIAHISFSDPELAAQELERAVRDGCKGAMVAPWTWTRESHAHPIYDPVWTKAQELDVPIGFHPAFEPTEITHHGRFKRLMAGEPVDFNWYFDVTIVQTMQQTFLALFHLALFDRFPQAKVVVLESQAGWIGYLLDRMDAVFHSPVSASMMKEPPSTYFARQCWISADPDEKALSKIIEFVGSDKFFWASDFPHPDHPPDYMEKVERLVQPLSAQARRQVLGENVERVYNL